MAERSGDMRYVLLGQAVACGLLLGVCAAADGPLSPEAVIRRYYELSIAGEQLTPEGQRKIDALFLTPPLMHRAVSDQPIKVVEKVVIKREIVKGTKAVYFIVNWLEFGTIEPSLHFVRREGSKPDTPVRGQEHYEVERGRDGQWKLGMGESTIRMGMEAAIRYVSAARDREVDPAITANADRTLSTLKQLAVGAAAQPTPLANRAPKTARTVVEEFCRLNGDGGQLTPEGWRRIASLFVEPGPPSHGKVIVIRDYVVSDAEIADDGRAGVMVEYIGLGPLNPETAVFETFRPPGGNKMRANLSLVQTKAGWKIEGAVPLGAVTVEAAMRYVTVLRDKTASERIKNNAERALAGLKRQLPPSSR